MKAEQDELTGKWWVDNGILDVGPFDTEDEADQHIIMMEIARRDLVGEKNSHGY